MNVKEATKAAAKHANSDGIGGDTGNSGPDVEEAYYCQVIARHINGKYII